MPPAPMPEPPVAPEPPAPEGGCGGMGEPEVPSVDDSGDPPLPPGEPPATNVPTPDQGDRHHGNGKGHDKGHGNGHDKDHGKDHGKGHGHHGTQGHHGDHGTKGHTGANGGDTSHGANAAPDTSTTEDTGPTAAELAQQRLDDAVAAARTAKTKWKEAQATLDSINQRLADVNERIDRLQASIDDVTGHPVPGGALHQMRDLEAKRNELASAARGQGQSVAYLKAEFLEAKEVVRGLL